VQIPKASQDVVEQAIAASVENGSVWFLAEPASILGEQIPAGVLTATAKLCTPPTMITAPEILPENLPGAWKDGEATALSIMTHLSQKRGKTLPWKTVKDAIAASLQARFTEVVDRSANWPCEVHEAKSVYVTVASTPGSDEGIGAPFRPANILVADADLEPSEIQDLGDSMPQLLEIKAKSNAPIRFRVRVEVGDGQELPPTEIAEQVNTVLKEVKESLQVQ
jgi:hypothetical protein